MKVKQFTQYSGGDIRIIIRVFENGSFSAKSHVIFKKFYNNNYKYVNSKRRSNAKINRHMGYHTLNEHFKDSHGHHISNNLVIFIPKELHTLIYHNLKTGQGMYEINSYSINYLLDTEETV